MREIVKAITLQLGLPAWDVSSSHGGRGGGTLAFRLSGFRAALARIGAEKVYQVLRGAQARERPASAENAAGWGAGLESSQVDDGRDVGGNAEAQRMEPRREPAEAAAVPPSPPHVEQSTPGNQGGEVERLRLELELERARAERAKAEMERAQARWVGPHR